MKVYLDTVGCRLNQSEIETFARQFRAAGHTLVPTAEQADLVVINTCAVTSQAASDSRQKIRQASRAGVPEIAVTGCWSTLEPKQAAALPGVRHVIANTDKDLLVANLLQLPKEAFELEPVEREPIPGARLRTRAFIKVQDGCDNRCTFCITTVARGKSRSRSVEEILSDIEAATDGGAQEIVLTGVHLGAWGQESEPNGHLRELVETILRRANMTRLRLSSLEPWDLSEDFFSLWQDKRLCRHLHLPLQSGSNRTLRRMARRTNQKSFARLVEAARRNIPELAITTDIITGFPGEDEAEFMESLSFVCSMEFAGGHVFTYSARPGTAAAKMPNQVPHEVKKERNALVREALQDSEKRYQRQFVGRTLAILWESATALGPDGWTLSGLSDNYLRITAQAPQRLWNQISTVRLQTMKNGKLQGYLLPPAGRTG